MEEAFQSHERGTMSSKKQMNEPYHPPNLERVQIPPHGGVWGENPQIFLSQAGKMRTQKQPKFAEQSPEKNKNSTQRIQGYKELNQHRGVHGCGKEQERNSKSAERKQD